MVKIEKNHLKIFYLIVIILLYFAFQTVVYSAFSSTTNIKGSAYARVEEDVRITGFGLISSNNATSSYEVFGKNYIASGIELSNTISSITYYVEITNYGFTDVCIFDINGLPNGVNYSIKDYALHDKICDINGKCNGFIKRTFEIELTTTSNYVGNVQMNFEFRRVHTITYTGITNDNYPTTVIDGDTLTFTVTTDIPPKIVAFTSNGERYDYNSYSYINNTFTFNNVTDDINLKYQEKGYLKTLSSDIDFKESAYKTIIDSVQFVNYVDTTGAIKVYDLSYTSGSKEVIGWITTENDLYIGSDWHIYSKDFQQFFSGMSGVKSIFFGNLNTSESISMYSSFKNCSGLTELDLSTFNTSNVVNMSNMFSDCTALTSLDLSSFNTSIVSNMEGMFNECLRLSRITLGPDFGFNGSGTSTLCTLPVQNTYYIPGADGNWYDEATGQGYAPVDVHRDANKTVTYVAIKPITYKDNFADNSWVEIAHACQNNKVPSTWAVGDIKTMKIGSSTYNVKIIGKNHDIYADGSGVAPLTFQTDAITKRVMNSSRTNAGGWDGSEMYAYLNDVNTGLINSIEFKDYIKPVSKDTNIGYVDAGRTMATAEDIRTTADRLFLLSVIEVFGTQNFEAYNAEGTRYAYYANGGSSSSWWMRTPLCTDDYYFFHNERASGGYGSSANNSNYFSFAFCF